MQVVFVSNYFNHHQLSFCDALYELLEGSFCFLQTQPMEEERVKMGWQAEERPYAMFSRTVRLRAARKYSWAGILAKRLRGMNGGICC